MWHPNGESTKCNNSRRRNKKERKLGKRIRIEISAIDNRMSAQTFKIIWWKRNGVPNTLHLLQLPFGYPRSFLPSYAVPFAAGCFGGISPVGSRKSDSRISLVTIPLVDTRKNCQRFIKGSQNYPLVLARFREDVTICGSVGSIRFSPGTLFQGFWKALEYSRLYLIPKLCC